MQHKKLKKNCTINQSELVQLDNIIKVKMSDEILSKIKYLCQKIPKVEWSGIILYTVEGTITKPDDMCIILEDIIPMDKGTVSYTKYRYNEKKEDSSDNEDKMIDFYNNNPIALTKNWRVGLIHSHNSMRVFFSNTDLEELKDNSPQHAYYFSLIVNNFMDFSAKVAIASESFTKIEEKFISVNEKARPYVIDFVTSTKASHRTYLYDCDIISNRNEIIVDETFKEQVKKIITQEKELKIPYNYIIKT